MRRNRRCLERRVSILQFFNVYPVLVVVCALSTFIKTEGCLIIAIQ